MTKTCGNCGHVVETTLQCHYAASDRSYYMGFTRPDAKPCKHWIEATNTLEQRYQQLAEVAKDATLALQMIETVAHETIAERLSHAALLDIQEALEELGVEV